MDYIFKIESSTSLVKFIALLTAILGTIFYRKYSKGAAKYFLILFWYIVVLEFSYKILYYEVFDRNIRYNWILTNVNFVIQPIAYMLIYRAFTKEVISKRMILILIIFYVVACTINSVFLENPLEMRQINSPILAMLLVVSSVLIYFKEVLESEFVLKLNKSVFFWFGLGGLLFHLASIPLWIFSEYMDYQGPIHNSILFMLNLLMHSCYIVGVTWSRREYNS